MNPVRIGDSPSAAVSLVKISPETSPLQFSVWSTTNAASHALGFPHPGGLASLQFTGLDLPNDIIATSTPLPYELSDLSVSVGNVPAPLLSLTNTLPGAGQRIIFQVPFEAASNYLEVRYKGFSTYAWPLDVGAGILTLPDGSPAIRHASDNSLVTPANPAAKGEDILVWATGLGAVMSPVASGTPAPTADPLTSSLVASGIGDSAITYAGLEPGFVGLYQVNIRLSPSLQPGIYKLSLLYPAQRQFSNAVDLPVR